MPRTQPRRGRIDPVAAVACLASLLVAALAIWGLQRDPLPAAADLGSSTPSARAPDGGSAAPGTAVDVATAVPDTRPATPSAAERGPAPERLLVPDLDLDVPLDAVGVADDGQMEIPEDADRAGWYRFGPRPGDDSGSAVVAGHVDDRSGPGAFLALTRAEEGDEIAIRLADGSELLYTVTSIRATDKKELPVDDLFDRDGSPRLQLITCTGEWSEREGSYSDNLVITAEPVG